MNHLLMKALYLPVAFILMFSPFAVAQESNSGTPDNSIRREVPDVLISPMNLDVFSETLTETGLKVFQNTGKATHEMKDDGFCASHPGIAVGQIITVVNMATGKEAEVTVIRQVPPSYGRIIDLSAGAWQELGLDDGSSVGIFISPAQSAASPATSANYSGYNTFPRQGRATHTSGATGLTAGHEYLRINTKDNCNQHGYGKGNRSYHSQADSSVF